MGVFALFTPKLLKLAIITPVVTKLANCTLQSDWLLKLTVMCKSSGPKKIKFPILPLHDEITNYPY